MTPRRLSAWCELLSREELRLDMHTARAVRVAGADQKHWTEWMKESVENAK